MNPPKKYSIVLIIGLLLALSLSCQVFSTEQPSLSRLRLLQIPARCQPWSRRVVAPPGEAGPGRTFSDYPTRISCQPGSARAACQNRQRSLSKDACIRRGSFLLERPIGRSGRNTIVIASRFGEYQQATKDAQTGVYFLNSTGTLCWLLRMGKWS